MIENIPTPLVSFAGSGVAGFLMGLFLRKVLKFIVIIIGSFLGSVFLVLQWMQARKYIQGQVDWNRVGNDTMAGFQPLLMFPACISLGHWEFPQLAASQSDWSQV